MKVEKDLSKLVYFLLLISVLLSCKNAEKREQQPKQEKKVEKIDLPDSLEIYNPFNVKNIDIKKLSQKQLKIYSFIDVSCPSCLGNIKGWAKIAIELKKYDIPIILICQSEDNYELLKYLCEKKDIEVQLPFYLDTKNQFFKKNKSLNSAPNEHTVLVDKENLLLLSGDPNLSEQIKNSYFDTIKNHN